MKIHEYQAKGVLRQYNVPVPRGEVAFTADEARQIAEKLGGRVVVKAQIHAGGRGKGGGVKLAKNPDEAAEIAKNMIGMTLIIEDRFGGAQTSWLLFKKRCTKSCGART